MYIIISHGRRTCRRITHIVQYITRTCTVVVNEYEKFHFVRNTINSCEIAYEPKKIIYHNPKHKCHSAFDTCQENFDSSDSRPSIDYVYTLRSFSKYKSEYGWNISFDRTKWTFNKALFNRNVCLCTGVPKNVYVLWMILILVFNE